MLKQQMTAKNKDVLLFCSVFRRKQVSVETEFAFAKQVTGGGDAAMTLLLLSDCQPTLMNEKCPEISSEHLHSQSSIFWITLFF